MRPGEHEDARPHMPVMYQRQVELIDDHTLVFHGRSPESPRPEPSSPSHPRRRKRPRWALVLTALNFALVMALALIFLPQIRQGLEASRAGPASPGTGMPETSASQTGASGPAMASRVRIDGALSINGRTVEGMVSVTLADGDYEVAGRFFRLQADLQLPDGGRLAHAEQVDVFPFREGEARVFLLSWDLPALWDPATVSGLRVLTRLVLDPEIIENTWEVLHQ